MDHFVDVNGEVYVEQLPLAALAKQYGTPLYVYSAATLSRHAQEIQNAFRDYPTLLAYAVKANSNIHILNRLFREGWGADLVSGGELQRALRAGGDPAKMVFSGVGKTRDEIAMALQAGILAFNVESAFELAWIEQIATAQQMTARVNLRINPNISVSTNAKITTGRYDHKFGIPEEEALALAHALKQTPQVELIGLTCHLGSQLVDLNPLATAALRVAQLCDGLRRDGHPIRVCDLGGGLGIRYDQETPPTLQAYAEVLINAVKPFNLQLIIEPGRVLMGNTAVLLSQVLGIKKTPAKTFAVIDAGMNDLLRPAMYDSYHDIQPCRPNQGAPKTYEIVGPICESSDVLGKDRSISPLKQDDYLLIRGVGAYGSAMASNYNSRPRPMEILIDNDQVHIIHQRETVEQLWQYEVAKGCSPI